MSRRANGEGSYSFDAANNRWLFRIIINGKKFDKASKKGESKKDFKKRISEFIEEKTKEAYGFLCDDPWNCTVCRRMYQGKGSGWRKKKD